MAMRMVRNIAFAIACVSFAISYGGAELRAYDCSHEGPAGPGDADYEWEFCNGFGQGDLCEWGGIMEGECDSWCQGGELYVCDTGTTYQLDYAYCLC